MENKLMTAMAQEKAFRGPKFFGWRILNMYSICVIWCNEYCSVRMLRAHTKMACVAEQNRIVF